MSEDTVLVRLHFYDDDHGPLSHEEVRPPGAFHTMAVPATAEEVTVELVIPQPSGLAGATDAEVLDAAGRLTVTYGNAEFDSLMGVVRKVLARLADRAREAGEPSPGELARRTSEKWEKHAMRLRDHTETVRLDLDGDDPYYQVVNPFHPRFHVVPVRVEAEFTWGEPDRDKALRGIRVTGQRYRSMADGSIRAVGPGRGHAEEPTTWYFPAGRAAGLAGDLLKMARAAAAHRKSVK